MEERKRSNKKATESSFTSSPIKSRFLERGRREILGYFSPKPRASCLPTGKIALGAGFTLIELVIVVIIIGILASIALPQYSRSREKAMDKQAQAMLSLLRSAERALYVKRGFYYPASGTVTDIRAISGNLSIDLVNDGNWNYSLRFDNGFNATLTRNKGGYSRNWQINASMVNASCVGNCY